MAATGISDAGAAPVGTNYNVCRYAASLPAPLLWYFFGLGWVEIFQFLVGWVGSTTAKVLKI